jgi:hypothetical protein
MASDQGVSDPVELAAAAADAARDRVTATMDDIQTRLDPRRMVMDTVERVQAGSRALAVQAGDAARAHPLALGAAVAALGLALLARNRLANARVDLGDEATDYTDYDDDYDDATPGRPQALVGAVVDDASEAVQANPSVAILVGLAAGAALGALLPTSAAERRTLGDAGNRLSAAARAAARQAADELDAAGLSVDSVKARASEATRKARGAARAVADAARAELKA